MSRAQSLEIRIRDTNFAVSFEPGVQGIRVRIRGGLLVTLGWLSFGWWHLAS